MPQGEHDFDDFPSERLAKRALLGLDHIILQADLVRADSFTKVETVDRVALGRWPPIVLQRMRRTVRDGTQRIVHSCPRKNNSFPLRVRRAGA